MMEQWPTDESRLIIEVIALDNESVFVVGAHGPIHHSSLAEIEARLNDEEADITEGRHLFVATWIAGQYGSDDGRTECEPYWDLEEIGYREFPDAHAERGGER